MIEQRTMIGQRTMARALLVATIAILALGRTAPGQCASSLSAADGDLARALNASGVYDRLPAAADAGPETLIVPVAVHVVRRSSGAQGLTIPEVIATLDDLQIAFAPDMIFCFADAIDFIDDDAFFFDIDTITEINTLRQTNVVPGAMNVYFTEELSAGVALCGISSFTFSSVQGIVIRNSCTAAGGNPSTTAHEVGHYFDLFHTHETALGVECPDGSNCATAGDLVCDTPADPGLGSFNVTPACVYIGNEPAPCFGSPDQYDPDPRNFMSYSRDECQTLFTSQQIDRMRATYLNLRPELHETGCFDVAFESAGGIEVLSLDVDGYVGNAHSSDASVSADGRFVVFASRAGGLVPNDTNNRWDVFLHDRQRSSTSRVSLNIAGDEANGDSRLPSITSDGRFVTFISKAPNMLDPGSVQAMSDQVYLRDLETGQLQRISRAMNGGVVNSQCDVTATTPDGRYVAYVTAANNVVPDDTNGFFGRDVFLFDTQTQTTERVNVSTDGAQADGTTTWTWDSIGISADGRFVTFGSYADNLVPGDANGLPDIFVRDTAIGFTERVSVGVSGQDPNEGSAFPQISADGRHVAFISSASNLVPNDTNGIVADVFLHDRETGETTIIARTDDGAQPNGSAFDLDMSPDARFVSFASYATNFDPAHVSGDLDIFVHDRVSGRTILASPRGGSSASVGATGPAVSADGSTVVFDSLSSDLAPHDINGFFDVFVTPVNTHRLGDVNGDGTIDFGDVLVILAAWGPCAPLQSACPADVNGDGSVGFADILFVLGNWSAVIPA